MAIDANILINVSNNESSDAKPARWIQSTSSTFGIKP